MLTVHGNCKSIMRIGVLAYESLKERLAAFLGVGIGDG